MIRSILFSARHPSKSIRKLSTRAMNPCQLVKETCQYVVEHASHVEINEEEVSSAALYLVSPSCPQIEWDREFHFYDGGPLTAQVLLVMDALNFCFWPDHTQNSDNNHPNESSSGALEYEHLAKGLKRLALSDPAALSAESLAAVDGPTIRAWLQWPRPLPLEEERARLVREVGAGLLAEYGGAAARLVEAAGGSAPKLVDLVTRTFPGFRDSVVYRGRQVFYYKRAQIFVSDLWGAFRGQGLGDFGDSINDVTMFADYRVPVTLRNLKVLEYSEELAALIDSGREVPFGSEYEAEVRAATVVAVERIREAMAAGAGAGAPKKALTCVEIDWRLWELGEARREVDTHHKTRTIFY